MSPPKTSRRFSRPMWAAIGLLLVGLCVRLGVTVWRTETGGESVLNHWRAATVGWFVEDVPLQEQLPADQAKFWLKEVDRVVAEHPDDPEILMGAAIVLDSPCMDYAQRPIRLATGFPLIASPWYGAMSYPNEIYEPYCAKRCLELAQRACDCDPEDRNLRQLYALLARNRVRFERSVLTEIEFEQIVKECAKQDPTNALYDYLAADCDWIASTKRSNLSDSLPFEVTDEVRNQRCYLRLEQGRRKEVFLAGSSELSLLQTFLQHSRASHDARHRIIQSWRLAQTRVGIFMSLHRAMYQLVRQAELRDAPQEAMAHVSVIDRYVEQRKRISVPCDQFDLRANFELTASQTRLTLVRAHPGEFTNEEVTRLRRSELESRVQVAIEWEASQDRQTSSRHLLVDSVLKERPLSASILLAASIASCYVILLLLIVLGAMIVKRAMPSRPQEASWLGWIAFPTAAISCFAIFGLAAAAAIPIAWQEWIATITLIAVPLLFFAFVLWKCHRGGRWQFSIADTLLTTTLVSAYLGLFSFLGKAETFSQLPLKLHVPAHSAMQAFDKAWQYIPHQLASSWVATIHWLAYGGPYLTVAIWAVLLAMFAFRRARLEKGGLIPVFRRFLSASSHAIARAGFVLLLASLLVYLSIAPSVLQLVEDDHQWRMSFARNPQMHLEQAKAAVEAIRANPARMAELTARIEKLMASDDARELAPKAK